MAITHIVTCYVCDCHDHPMREWDAIGCGHFCLRAWHSYRIPHPSRRGMLRDFNMYGDLPYSSGSIEIDHIDVSNLRRFSSRRNRIGSNRTNVTKSAVQWEFEYAFFALTLNPMGKRRCLEIEDYAGDTSRTPAGICGKSEMSIEQVDSFTLQAEFRYLVVFTAGLLSSSPRNQCEDPERSMEFIRFLHIQMSSRRRNKAKTLRWDRSDRVLDRFDV